MPIDARIAGVTDHRHSIRNAGDICRILPFARIVAAGRAMCRIHGTEAVDQHISAQLYGLARQNGLAKVGLRQAAFHSAAEQSCGQPNGPCASLSWGFFYSGALHRVRSSVGVMCVSQTDTNLS